MAIKRNIKIRSGFSLMELLVVIAIIMMLIGILVPGIQGVKRIAKNLEQKSLFHNIEIGLETYRTDFGDFPESKRKIRGSLYFTGAQHLAEAMVGRDGRGLEPSQASRWEWPGLPAGSDLYTTQPKSIDRRQPIYVNLKDTGAFLLSEMYGSGNTGNVVSENNGQRAPVIADMFYRKKITIGSTGEMVKVGSPILYFKADRSSKIYHKDSSGFGSADFNKWKFNYNDNEPLINLGTMEDTSVSNYMDAADFYKTITDLNAPFDRPLNENTYILISAGYDGIFGTNPRNNKNDDITNIKVK